MRRAGVAVALAVLALGAAGAQARPADMARLDGCLRLERTTAVAHFRADGDRLVGAVLGRGRTGVVLADQSDRDLCGWLPFARTLAAQGFRVMLFDYGFGSPDREVGAAAGALRRLGAEQIVLAGASEGAKAAILASAEHPQLAAAVVALSPERFLRRRDVLPAARRLAVPALFVVATDDAFSAKDTPALAAAIRRTHARLVEVPGGAHGVDLLRGPAAATAGTAVFDFLQPLGPTRRPPRLGTECGSAVAASAPAPRPVAFTAGDGVQLHGVALGTGDTALVLAHEYPNDLCGWFPYAAEVARGGTRVLLFDHRGKGTRLDLDVVAGVEKARELGATRVVAMGASLGGAATLVAAGRDCFSVSGIVSASGETDLRSYGRGVPPLYAVPYERRIAAPLLVVGSKDDALVDETAVDRLLARASSTSKRALLVDGADHGWDLLQGVRANASIREAVGAFVAGAGALVPTGCG